MAKLVSFPRSLISEITINRSQIDLLLSGATMPVSDVRLQSSIMAHGWMSAFRHGVAPLLSLCRTALAAIAGEAGLIEDGDGVV